jgi:hypothetical protein
MTVEINNAYKNPQWAFGTFLKFKGDVNGNEFLVVGETDEYVQTLVVWKL